MGNTVLGVVAPLPQGAWNSTTTYQKLSVVREGNSSYIAKSANVNIQPGVTDSWETYWMLLNEDGDIGQAGPQGETGVGVPDGGLKGNILVKRSQSNYDDEWVDPANITVGNATKALQDGNGNNIADTYQTKQDSTTQNTALQTQITSNTKVITQNSQLISRNSARLTNVEQRISPSPFVTDSTVAYVKDVPANALPYAELQKLGGMTRKCTNLVNISDVTINTSAFVFRSVKIPFPLTVGTYTFSFNASGYVTGAQWELVMLDADGVSVIDQQNAYIRDNNTITFTITGVATTMDLYANSNVGGTFSNFTLNQGATALPYEPYFEGLRSAPVTSVESVGANLLPSPYSIGGAGTVIENSGGRIEILSDGGLSLSGTPTAFAGARLYRGSLLFKGEQTLSLQGTFNNYYVTVFLYDSPSLENLIVQIPVSGKTTFNTNDYPTATYMIIDSGRSSSGVPISGTAYPMLNKGSTALPYAPYTKSTLPIPEAVQALDGYGEGINESVYNYITWNPEGNVKTYTKAVGVVDLGTLDWGVWRSDSTVFIALLESIASLSNTALCDKYSTLITDSGSWYDIQGYNKVIYKPYNSKYLLARDTDYTDKASFKAAMAGVMLYYELATPEVTDISALITADNLLPVQGNGTITFVNEYGYAVPSTVEYMT